MDVRCIIAHTTFISRPIYEASLVQTKANLVPFCAWNIVANFYRPVKVWNSVSTSHFVFFHSDTKLALTKPFFRSCAEKPSLRPRDFKQVGGWLWCFKQLQSEFPAYSEANILQQHVNIVGKIELYLVTQKSCDFRGKRLVKLNLSWAIIEDFE